MFKWMWKKKTFAFYVNVSDKVLIVWNQRVNWQLTRSRNEASGYVPGNIPTTWRLKLKCVTAGCCKYEPLLTYRWQMGFFPPKWLFYRVKWSRATPGKLINPTKSQHSPRLCQRRGGTLVFAPRCGRSDLNHRQVRPSKNTPLPVHDFRINHFRARCLTEIRDQRFKVTKYIFSPALLKLIVCTLVDY